MSGWGNRQQQDYVGPQKPEATGRRAGAEFRLDQNQRIRKSRISEGQFPTVLAAMLTSTPSFATGKQRQQNIHHSCGEAWPMAERDQPAYPKSQNAKGRGMIFAASPSDFPKKLWTVLDSPERAVQPRRVPDLVALRKTQTNTEWHRWRGQGGGFLGAAIMCLNRLARNIQIQTGAQG